MARAQSDLARQRTVEWLMAPEDAADAQTMLHQLVHRPPWHALANCRGVGPAAFVVERGGQYDTARALCAGCIVRSECLAVALADVELQGMWAGTSESQRKTMRRTSGDVPARRRASTTACVHAGAGKTRSPSAKWSCAGRREKLSTTRTNSVGRESWGGGVGACVRSVSGVVSRRPTTAGYMAVTRTKKRGASWNRTSDLSIIRAVRPFSGVRLAAIAPGQPQNLHKGTRQSSALGDRRAMDAAGLIRQNVTPRS